MIKNFLLAAFAVLFTVNTADAGVIFESAGDQDYSLKYEWINVPGNPHGATTNYFVGSTFSSLSFSDHPCETFTDACFQGEMFQGAGGSNVEFQAYLDFHGCDVNFPPNPTAGWNYFTQECTLDQVVEWTYTGTNVTWEGVSEYGELKQEAIWYCTGGSCTYHGTTSHTLMSSSYGSSTTEGTMYQGGTGYYGKWAE